MSTVLKIQSDHRLYFDRLELYNDTESKAHLDFRQFQVTLGLEATRNKNQILGKVLLLLPQMFGCVLQVDTGSPFHIHKNLTKAVLFLMSTPQYT